MRAWLEAQNADTNEHEAETRMNWKRIERHVIRLQRQLANAVEFGKGGANSGVNIVSYADDFVVTRYCKK